MQKSLSARRYDYDLLRVLSMLGVIYLHSAAGALRAPANVPVWQVSNALTSLATAAVPLFFMLSGALLLSSEKTTDLSYLLRKRLPRVLVPLLVWSGVVVLITWRKEGSDAALATLLPLLNTPVLVPYWFVYALVPVYLLSPFLKKMIDGLSPVHWRYLLTLWFGLTLGLNTLADFLPKALAPVVTVHWTLNLNLIGGYLGYFLLGYYLEHLERFPTRRVLWGTAGGSYLLILFGTLWDTLHTGGYDERFKSYLNLFAAVLAAAIFLLARSYLREHQPGGRLLTLLSGASFGVYLVHPLAIETIRNWWPRVFSGEMALIDTIGEQLLFYALVALGCTVGVVVVSSIKPLCYPLTGQRFAESCRESNLFALLGGKRAI